jgi:hypothetical protein
MMYVIRNGADEEYLKYHKLHKADASVDVSTSCQDELVHVVVNVLIHVLIHHLQFYHKRSESPSELLCCVVLELIPK